MPVFVSWDVFVEVREAPRCRLGDVAQLVPRHHVGLQVVCQRALDGTNLFILNGFERSRPPKRSVLGARCRCLRVKFPAEHFQ